LNCLIIHLWMLEFIQVLDNIQKEIIQRKLNN
jgi:hypothetical protein